VSTGVVTGVLSAELPGVFSVVKTPKNTPRQIPLAIQVSDHSLLDNFYVGSNAELMAYLSAFDVQDEPSTLLWGEPGVGVSFLLQAMANAHHAPYIPLSHIKDIGPEMLQGMESMPLVCIDDLDLVRGNLVWQEALFHFFNASRQLGHAILFGSHVAPGGLDLELDDLLSRLTWGHCFQVIGLTDDQKEEALIQRANQKGLELDNVVAQYLLTHYPRDLQRQFQLLDQLDHASLAMKRRLTIPFIKSFLGK
jgi:DnaA family protein